MTPDTVELSVWRRVGGCHCRGLAGAIMRLGWMVVGAVLAFGLGFGYLLDWIEERSQVIEGIELDEATQSYRMRQVLRATDGELVLTCRVYKGGWMVCGTVAEVDK